MGLSILIPVYNYTVDGLVQTLSTQLQRSGREGEIILLDDGSVAEFQNQYEKLSGLPAVIVHKGKKNEGRMAARLVLSGFARFDYLLFLDADSEIIQSDFLGRYFDQVDAGQNLVSGGREYNSLLPEDCDFRLHWKYGTVRESRNNNSQTGFMSNNFLIRKTVFDSLDQTLTLRDYGHEDSWWGIQFEKQKLGCLHINNPVKHGALEKSAVFLAKSETALQNIFLLQKNTDGDLLKKHIKIYRWYRKLKSTGLAGMFLFFEKPFHNRLKNNLLSCKPSLFYFDCYRLAEMARIGKNLKH